jgi:hypothetical protein
MFVINNKMKKGKSILIYPFCGELGIRTPGPVTVNSFQDCRNRPLCQLSAAKIRFEIVQPKSFIKQFAAGLYLLPPQDPLNQQ